MAAQENLVRDALVVIAITVGGTLLWVAFGFGLALLDSDTDRGPCGTVPPVELARAFPEYAALWDAQERALRRMEAEIEAMLPTEGEIARNPDAADGRLDEATRRLEDAVALRQRHIEERRALCERLVADRGWPPRTNPE